MAFSSFQFVLAAQLLIFIAAEGNKGSDRMDACVKAASSNETKCKELSARCTWSEEKQVCYSNHSGRGEDHHGGKGNKGSDRMDICVKAASSNETKCKELSARCTWSEEKKVCYLKHSGRAEDRDGGKGNKGSDRMDACMKAASSNETKCKELSARCTWSEEKKVCYLKQSGRVENRHGGEGNKGSDTMDARDVVDFTLRLNNIQFSLLSANPSVLSEFKLKMKSIIADKASQRVMPEHVSLDLKPGSVIVVASVAPPSGVSADEVQSTLGEKLKQLDDVAAAVSQVPGIKSVTSGAITVTLVSAPVARSTLQSSEAQASESSKLPFMIGALAGGAALLAFVSLACFLCKGAAPAGKAALPKTVESQEINNVIVFGNVV